jgi:hypothetical protein
MENNSKLQIYKGMIQYLLESTNYTIKNIAELSNTSINSIRSIYYENRFSLNILSEITLINLYRIILEINQNNSLEFINSPKRNRIEVMMAWVEDEKEMRNDNQAALSGGHHA